jgi:hypothetical protein
MPLLQKVRNLCQKIPVKRFNNFCFALSMLWLAITIPLGILLRPTVTDFGQFYIGGLLASRGDWDALYPFPIQGSLDNAGLSIHSHAKPKWTFLCRRNGVKDYTHFILPPPSALLFIPLSMVPYSQAFWAWTFLLTICVLGVALITGRLFRNILGHPSRFEGFLMLWIVISPMSVRAIRIANVSPPIALTLGLALLALLHKKESSIHGAWAVLLGALLKYATLVFTPLILAMKRWNMLFWLGFLSIILLVVTVSIAGIDPFIEFQKVILPTLSRPSAFRGNQSLPGMLARIYGRPFPPLLSLALNSARLIFLGLILKVIFSFPKNQWHSPVHVLSATGLLLSWLFIFSPIAWEHWPILLCPLWSWLLWEACQDSLKRILAITSLILMWIPAGILQVDGFLKYKILIPEPFNSTQLLGVTILLALAFARMKTFSEAKQTISHSRTDENMESEIDKCS